MTFEGFCQNGDNRRMSTYKLADHQWQKLHAFLQGHPRAYAGQEEKCPVSPKPLDIFWTPASSGVNCQPTLASGTVSSSATHAGKRTVSGPTCSNSSLKTRTRQRSCPTVQLYSPICAPRAAPKKGRQNEQCPGRSRGGFSSKIHLLVDALGFPLQFILTGGERHDLSHAESLLAPFHFDAVIADKGYDSDPLRELLTAKQVEVVIPSRHYRKQPRDYDRHRYKEGNIVERFINRIKCYRRIFTRYDKLARRFMAFLHFAAILIWLERNVNEP